MDVGEATGKGRGRSLRSLKSWRKMAEIPGWVVDIGSLPEDVVDDEEGGEGSERAKDSRSSREETRKSHSSFSPLVDLEVEVDDGGVSSEGDGEGEGEGGEVRDLIPLSHNPM